MDIFIRTVYVKAKSQFCLWLWLGLFLVMFPNKTRGLSDLKICGDSECEIFMSRVVAIKNFKGPDCRFLSFKKGDVIFVYYKLAGKRDDLWAGTRDKDFGHFPKDAVKVDETHVTKEKEITLPTERHDFFCMDDHGTVVEIDDTEEYKEWHSENEDIISNEEGLHDTSENTDKSQPSASKNKDADQTGDISHEVLPEASAQGGSSWIGSAVTGWFSTPDTDNGDSDNSDDNLSGEDEKQDTFRKRKLALDDEQLEEKSSMFGWFGSELTNALGYGEQQAEKDAANIQTADGERQNGEEKSAEKQEPPSGEYSSWLNIGIGDVLKFGGGETAETDKGTELSQGLDTGVLPKGEQTESEHAPDSMKEIKETQSTETATDNVITDGNVDSLENPQEPLRGMQNKDRTEEADEKAGADSYGSVHKSIEGYNTETTGEDKSENGMPLSKIEDSEHMPAAEMTHIKDKAESLFPSDGLSSALGNASSQSKADIVNDTDEIQSKESEKSEEHLVIDSFSSEGQNVSLDNDGDRKHLIEDVSDTGNQKTLAEEKDVSILPADSQTEYSRDGGNMDAPTISETESEEKADPSVQSENKDETSIFPTEEEPQKSEEKSSSAIEDSSGQPHVSDNQLDDSMMSEDSQKISDNAEQSELVSAVTNIGKATSNQSQFNENTDTLSEKFLDKAPFEMDNTSSTEDTTLDQANVDSEELSEPEDEEDIMDGNTQKYSDITSFDESTISSDKQSITDNQQTVTEKPEQSQESMSPEGSIEMLKIPQSIERKDNGQSSDNDGEKELEETLSSDFISKVPCSNEPYSTADNQPKQNDESVEARSDELIADVISSDQTNEREDNEAQELFNILDDADLSVVDKRNDAQQEVSNESLIEMNTERIHSESDALSRQSDEDAANQNSTAEGSLERVDSTSSESIIDNPDSVILDDTETDTDFSQIKNAKILKEDETESETVDASGNSDTPTQNLEHQSELYMKYGEEKFQSDTSEDNTLSPKETVSEDTHRVLDLTLDSYMSETANATRPTHSNTTTTTEEQQIEKSALGVTASGQTEVEETHKNSETDPDSPTTQRKGHLDASGNSDTPTQNLEHQSELYMKYGKEKFQSDTSEDNTLSPKETVSEDTHRVLDLTLDSYMSETANASPPTHSKTTTTTEEQQIEKSALGVTASGQAEVEETHKNSETDPDSPTTQTKGHLDSEKIGKDDSDAHQKHTGWYDNVYDSFAGMYGGRAQPDDTVEAVNPLDIAEARTPEPLLNVVKYGKDDKDGHFSQGESTEHIPTDLIGEDEKNSGWYSNVYEGFAGLYGGRTQPGDTEDAVNPSDNTAEQFPNNKGEMGTQESQFLVGGLSSIFETFTVRPQTDTADQTKDHPNDDPSPEKSNEDLECLYGTCSTLTENEKITFKDGETESEVQEDEGENAKEDDHHITTHAESSSVENDSSHEDAAVDHSPITRDHYEFQNGDGIKSGSLAEGSYKVVTTTEIGEGHTVELINWILTLVVSSLPDDLKPGPDLYGMPWEAVIFTTVLGLCIILLFSCRFYLSVKSRLYARRERKLAQKVAEAIDEKCKVLQELSEAQREYDKVKAIAENGGLLADVEEKQKLESMIRQMQESNAQMEKDVVRLEERVNAQKETRMKEEQRLAQLQETVKSLEGEAKNLKSQLEQSTTTLKIHNMNSERLQKKLQASREESVLLRESNKQLSQETEGWGERLAELEDEMKMCESSHQRMLEDCANKDEHIKSLTECLLKMKDWDSELEDEANGDGSPTSTGTENGDETDHHQKQKIQKLIYAAKLNADLRSLEEDKNRVVAKLSDEIKAKEDLQGGIEQLEQQKEQLQEESSKFSIESQKLQQKLAIMTEMYHENELKLHRMLTVEEKERLQKEEKLTKADQRITLAAEELNNYKVRAEELSEEMDKTNQAYKNQIASHEKKAHDNWLAARAAERDLADIKRENAHLRQKLTDYQFKLEVLEKDPYALDAPGRPLFRGERSPYGPSPLGRPASETRAFLSPPTLMDGPPRLSPQFPMGPGGRVSRGLVEPPGAGGDFERSGGPHSDSGSISPSWERERRGPPGPLPPPGHPYPEPGLPFRRPPPGAFPMGPLPPRPPFPPEGLPPHAFGPGPHPLPSDKPDSSFAGNSTGISEAESRDASLMSAPGDVPRMPPDADMRMGPPGMGPPLPPLDHRDPHFQRRGPYGPPDFFPPRGPGGIPLGMRGPPPPGMFPRYPPPPHMGYPPVRPPLDGFPPGPPGPPPRPSPPGSEQPADQTPPPQDAI